MAKFGFETSEFEGNSNNFEIMPEGEYTLKATEADLKETKKGDGAYLAVTFEVVKGAHAGRKVWQNFNIHNPSEKAQQIGREQVAGWGKAAGKPNAQDSDELLERNFQAKLGIEKGTGGYSDKNLIKAFLTPSAASSAEPAAAAAPKAEKKSAPAAPAAAPAGDKKKNPWD
jgi:hypothetical protein